MKRKLLSLFALLLVATSVGWAEGQPTYGEKITIDERSNGYTYVYGNGNDITIEEGGHGDGSVKISSGEEWIEFEDGDKVVFYGGASNKAVEKSSVKMTGGTISDFYGGGYGLAAETPANVKGTTSIVIEKGTITNIFIVGGRAFASSLGEATVTVGTDGSSTVSLPTVIVGGYDAGGTTNKLTTAYDASVNKVPKVTFTMNGGTIETMNCGGGQGYSYSKTTDITLNKVKVNSLYGVGSNGSSDEVTLNATECDFSAENMEISAVNRGKVGTLSMTFDNCKFPANQTNCHFQLGATHGWADSDTDGKDIPTVSDAITVDFINNCVNVPTFSVSEGLNTANVTVNGAKGKVGKVYKQTADEKKSRKAIEITEFTLNAGATWTFNNGLEFADEATLTNSGTLIYGIETADQLKETIGGITGTGQCTINAKLVTLTDALAKINEPTATTLPENTQIICQDARLFDSKDAAEACAETDLPVFYAVKGEGVYTAALKEASIYYVSEAGSGTQTGASADNALPARFLQAAIHAATSDVKLAAGTYTGNFIMKEGVNLTGADKATTILQAHATAGSATGRVITYAAEAIYDSEASEVPNDQLAKLTVWSNLTIRNGKEETGAGGGALICKNVTLKDCLIKGNESAKGGGVLCNFGGELINCEVSGNKATSGGGVVLNNGGNMRGCVVSGNEATGTESTGHSGGIGTRMIDADQASLMLIEDCKVFSNKAYDIAGVATNWGVTVKNTLVYGNTAAKEADGIGGLCVSKNVQILNSTIWGNTGLNVAVDATEVNLATITNTLMQDFTKGTDETYPMPVITYSASTTELKGEILSGNILLKADGLLFTDAAKSDYTLANGAPVIDKGIKGKWTADSKDLAGNLRIQGTAIDMGAYESPYKETTEVSSSDALEKALEEGKSEIEITGTATPEGTVEMTIEKPITVSGTITIKSSDSKPVVVKAAEGKSAFITATNAVLNLSGVALTTADPSTPVVVVAGNGTVVLNKTSSVSDATIEVGQGILKVEEGAVFTQAADKASLDVKTNATIEVAGALFSGKAIAVAADATNITLSLEGCSFAPVKVKAMLLRASDSETLGAIIAAGNADATINRCQMIGVVGEGTLVSGTKVKIYNSLFYGNGNMRLIDIAAGSTIEIMNNTFMNGTASALSASSVLKNESDASILKNNILWTKAAASVEGGKAVLSTIANNAMKISGTATNANIALTAKPSFASSTDFRLNTGSSVDKQLIGSGDATVAVGTKDVYGNARQTSGRINIGAVEATYTYVSPSTPDDGEEEDLAISVTGITLDKDKAMLHVGETLTLKATVVPGNADNKDVTWKSSDATIATVDNTGNVTALKAGKALITVTTKDQAKTATCEISVLVPTGIETVSAGSRAYAQVGAIVIYAAETMQVEVINLAGRTVYNQAIGLGETRIQVPAGVYALIFRDEDRIMATQKISVR